MAYKIVFSEMKQRVGVDDVAYALGYSLNRKAGVGKYIELVQGPLSNPLDTIIVHNTSSKGQQTFFRRNGSKGDVITLIRENLNLFNVPGNDEWTRIANVLAGFANMPYVENNERDSIREKGLNAKSFNPERFTTIPLNPEKPHWILEKRGFTIRTIKDFGDTVTLIKDNELKNFDGYNIGFPYHNPQSNKLSGYEIRGGSGFKSKAAGTDSSNSFWSAEFPKGSDKSTLKVYLFESGFDAMAFYQLNKPRISAEPFALVSMGGSFTQSQIEGVIKKYPGAILFDCFDNDLAGNVYSANLVKIIDKKKVGVDYKGEGDERTVILRIDDKEVRQKTTEFNFEKAAKEVGVTYSIKHWKPPLNFKDWNDCLLGEGISKTITPSKYQRDRNLAEKRKGFSL